MWMGNFEEEKVPAQDKPHMSDGRYTQSDSGGGSTGTVWMRFRYYMGCQTITSESALLKAFETTRKEWIVWIFVSIDNFISPMYGSRNRNNDCWNGAIATSTAAYTIKSAVHINGIKTLNKLRERRRQRRYIPQSSSSLKSPQSLSASHCQIVSTHLPLVQWNSFGSQFNGFTTAPFTHLLAHVIDDQSEQFVSVKQPLCETAEHWRVSWVYKVISPRL